MHLKIQFILLPFFISFLIFGCSGGLNPNSPPVDNPDSIPQAIPAENYTGVGNHYLWGYYNIYIDPDTCEFEYVPMRIASDHWNVLGWLEKGPCYNCFKVKNVSPTPNGTLQVIIEITHPFANLNLTGFDVRGIAMGYGTKTFPVSGLLITDRKLGQTELVNADGYTALYNVTTMGSGPGGLMGYIHGKYATSTPYPNTILNGYKRHITPNPANTRNAFYAGTSNTQVYEIFKPAGAFVLGYAVDAFWAPPASKPVDDPSTDFPPEANCVEPWKIDVTQVPVGLGLTAEGGKVVLKIDVYDYQGKMSHYVPYVECPELFNGKIYSVFKADGAGFATFETTVENKKLAGNGMYKCLVTVTDITNDSAPDWLDLTAYQIEELGVGTNAPPNVTGFQASDGDPSLYDRKVRLTWDVLNDTVDWYDIYKLEYDWAAGWNWQLVKSAAHPTNNWMDNNPRYCGTSNPIQYRICARNDAGSSPGFATDTGYPKLRNVAVTIWCVADDSGGGGASTSWDRAMADYNDCNAFWNRYGLNMRLVNTGGFLWVGNSAYKNISEAEADTMHDSFGKAQYANAINIYYVSSADGNPGKAYCRSMCPYQFHNTENVFIIIGRDARGAPPNEFRVIMAHEIGHAVGHFYDVYLLDKNGNMKLDDGANCSNTNLWCTEPPYPSPLYCNPNAAYQQEPDALKKNPWNLMWYSAPAKGPSSYDLWEGQYIYFHEWLNSNKANYPFP